MKHVLCGQKSVLVGDSATNTLVDYAAHLAQLRTGARVDVRAFSDEGKLIVVTFLLNAATDLVAESTDLPLDEPDNREAEAHMRKQIDRFSVHADFFRGFDLAEGGAEGLG